MHSWRNAKCEDDDVFYRVIHLLYDPLYENHNQPPHNGSHGKSEQCDIQRAALPWNNEERLTMKPRDAIEDAPVAEIRERHRLLNHACSTHFRRQAVLVASAGLSRDRLGCRNLRYELDLPRCVLAPFANERDHTALDNKRRDVGQWI